MQKSYTHEHCIMHKMVHDKQPVSIAISVAGVMRGPGAYAAVTEPCAKDFKRLYFPSTGDHHIQPGTGLSKEGLRAM